MVINEEAGNIFYQNSSIVLLAQWLTFFFGLSSLIASGISAYQTIVYHKPVNIVLRITFIIFPCMLASVALFYASLVFFAVI
jgi:hypothetical protein